MRADSLRGTQDGRVAVVEEREANSQVSVGYLIQQGVGTWIIEDDPAGRVYRTAEQAAEALLEQGLTRDGNPPHGNSAQPRN